MQYWSVWQKQHESHEFSFSEPVTSLSSHPCQVKPFRLKISMLGVYHCLTQGARSSAEAAKSRGYAGPTGFQYTNWMCPLMTMVEMEHTFDPSAVACKKNVVWKRKKTPIAHVSGGSGKNQMFVRGNERLITRSLKCSDHDVQLHLWCFWLSLCLPPLCRMPIQKHCFTVRERFHGTK